MDETPTDLTKSDLEQMLSTAIADCNISRLEHPPGDDVLEVGLTLRAGKEVRLIAKVFPRDAGAAGRLRRSLALRREIDVHQLVVPEYRGFQEERGVLPRDRLDPFRRCVAARVCRLGDEDGTPLAGEGSVLLVEDIRTQGYVPGDDAVGLDLGQTEFVVTQLARFHATGIAVKLAKPLVFKNKVVKALGPHGLHGCRDSDVSRSRSLLEALKRRSEFEDHADKISELLSEDTLYGSVGTHLSPFATVVHNDLRMANMMFKCDSPKYEERRISGLKIVNFGNACYGSLVSDLVFFLLSGTKSSVAFEHVDRLLSLYHETFVSSLDKLDCKSRRFSFEMFARELKTFSVYELPRILCTLASNMNRSKVLDGISNDH